MILNLKVEQKYIDKGVPKTCYSCPIALTFKDQYLKYRFVQVDLHQISIAENETSEREYEAKLPNDAVQFIKKFDAREFVEPFEFSLEFLGLE